MFMLSVGLIIYGLVDAAFIAFMAPLLIWFFRRRTSCGHQQHSIAKSVKVSARTTILLMMAPFVVIVMFYLRGFANFVSIHGVGIHECAFDHGHASVF